MGGRGGIGHREGEAGMMDVRGQRSMHRGSEDGQEEEEAQLIERERCQSGASLVLNSRKYTHTGVKGSECCESCSGQGVVAEEGGSVC